MNALFEAAKEVGEFMAAQGWGDEEPYVTAILGRFESRIPDGREFALTRRVLLIRASNGNDVDIALGALPFEAGMVRRAVPVEFAAGLILPCCTAEDLFIMKSFAARPRDWLDAESIVSRQMTLDSDYILACLSDLCELKDTPEILERAKRLLTEKP